MVSMRWLSACTAAIGIALLLLVSSCQVDRAGLALPSNNVKLIVEPELACPDERVAVRWDLTTLPRAPANCRRCTSSADCSEGFGCLDGVCCRGPGLSGGTTCNVGGQCPPTTINMTLTATDPAVPDPILPRPLPLRSGISLPVNRTMDVVAAGEFTLPLQRIDDRAHVRVPVDLDDRLPLRFDFACTGRGFTWTTYDFSVLGPSTSELIRIEGIRNTSGRAVALTGGVPSRGPVRIEAGEVTTAFDGSPARGLWLAFIPPDARLGLPTPICRPTEVLNRLPDISVELRLTCRRR